MGSRVGSRVKGVVKVGVQVHRWGQGSRRFGSRVMGAVKGGVKGQPERGDSWQGQGSRISSRVESRVNSGVKGGGLPHSSRLLMELPYKKKMTFFF